MRLLKLRRTQLSISRSMLQKLKERCKIRLKLMLWLLEELLGCQKVRWDSMASINTTELNSSQMAKKLEDSTWKEARCDDLESSNTI